MLMVCPHLKAKVKANFITGGYASRPETTPNQGSRALIIPQTCRGSFSAISKPILQVTVLHFLIMRSRQFDLGRRVWVPILRLFFFSRSLEFEPGGNHPTLTDLTAFFPALNRCKISKLNFCLEPMKYRPQSGTNGF